MKLARKLTLALLMGIWTVLGVHAFLEVGREARSFEEDLLEDLSIIGRALRPAVTRVWLREGEVLAMQVLEYDEMPTRRVSIRWVWLNAPFSDPHRPNLKPEYLTRVALGEEVFWIADATEHDDARAFLYVPVALDPLPLGALELSESLAPERQYLRETITRLAITTGMMALVSGLITLFLGMSFVGRPMRKLAEKARRIGTGDLGEPLVLKQKDEIGELATEINAMCERLAQAQDRITSETGARISALEQLRHADRLMTVGKLASGIAHELGTPLNVVAGRARMIMEPDVTPEEVSQNARIVLEQSERMTRIIRQLLDFARRRGPQKAPCNLPQVARQTVSLLKPLAEKRGVQTAVLAPDDLADVEADGAQIQQVLTNLVVNAVQAMPKGGTVTVTLTDEDATPPPDHGGERGRWLRCDVADTGAGIAPEHQAHIFEPFFTTKDVGEGTGLGLSVAYGMIREHGGWIAVRSQLGQGSTFSVYLPRSPAA
jgi:signal transduction histidine kinase